MAMGIQPAELIAGYCDLDLLKSSLHSQNSSAVRKEIDRAMRGFLAEKPDNETLSLLVNCLFVVLQYDVFFDFLNRRGLTLGETHSARVAMRKDWSLRQNGEALSDAQWLSENDETKKQQVFEAIESLHLTADDFDEIPAPEMKEPKWQKKTYGDFELVTIADAEITDDGGLSASPDPVGKDFVLRDADGVTYYLYHVRKSDIPGNMDMEDGRLYTADGRIDGYTGEQLREIEFEIYDGGVIFTYTTDGVDDSAAERDPRWMPYEIWVQGRIAKRRAQQAAFLAQYL